MIIDENEDMNWFLEKFTEIVEANEAKSKTNPNTQTFDKKRKFGSGFFEVL